MASLSKIPTMETFLCLSRWSDTMLVMLTKSLARLFLLASIHFHILLELYDSPFEICGWVEGHWRDYLSRKVERHLFPEKGECNVFFFSNHKGNVMFALSNRPLQNLMDQMDHAYFCYSNNCKCVYTKMCTYKNKIDYLNF